MEVLAVVPFFYSDPIVFPERYHRKLFWIIRLILGVMAGGLALAFGAQTPVLALNIGASAPLILKALAQSIPPSVPIQAVIPKTSADVLPASSADHD